MEEPVESLYTKTRLLPIRDSYPLVLLNQVTVTYESTTTLPPIFTHEENSMSITHRKIPSNVTVPRGVYLASLNEIMGSLTMTQINLVKPEVVDPAIHILRAEIRRVRKAAEDDMFEWQGVVDQIEKLVFSLVSDLEVCEDSEVERHIIQRTLVFVGSRAVSVVADFLVQSNIREMLLEEGVIEEGDEFNTESLTKLTSDDIRDTSGAIGINPNSSLAKARKKMH